MVTLLLGKHSPNVVPSASIDDSVVSNFALSVIDGLSGKSLTRLDFIGVLKYSVVAPTCVEDTGKLRLPLISLLHDQLKPTSHWSSINKNIIYMPKAALDSANHKT